MSLSTTPMPTPAPAPAPAATPAPGVLDPTLRERARRHRGVLIVIGLLVGTAALLAWAGSGARVGYLDPDAADPGGARALAQVLRGQGVEVTVLRRADEVPAAVASHPAGSVTLVVAGPLPATGRTPTALASARPAATVLVEPSQSLLDALLPAARLADRTTEVRATEPACADAVATSAGPLDLSGSTYTVAGGAASGSSAGTVCYRLQGIAEDPSAASAGALVRGPVTTGLSGVTLLGDGSVLTNARLGEGGDAALGLGLLGAHPSVVWYVPTLADPGLDSGGTPARPADLLPSWIPILVAQVLVAALLLAFARGRRMGRVVTEPLPVVVRAAESVQGRARLYRRGRSRGHAAAVLRRRTTRSCALALGLPPTTDAVTVGVAAAARTGRPAHDLVSLLTAADPVDDAALVRLADALDALDQEVRRP